MHQITATQFKARCLRLLDDVAESGAPLIITKHGRPVARLEPISSDRTLVGSVTFRVPDDELIAASMGRWDVEAE